MAAQLQGLPVPSQHFSRVKHAAADEGGGGKIDFIEPQFDEMAVQTSIA